MRTPTNNSRYSPLAFALDAPAEKGAYARMKAERACRAAIVAAQAADDAFEAALKADGFKSRWDCYPLNGSAALQNAYRAKLKADAAMHLAFEASRRTGAKCTNAEAGTFNHECGRPATWIAVKQNGFTTTFCDDCKERGRERHGYVVWQAIVS